MDKICLSCWKHFNAMHSCNKYCSRICAWLKRRTLKVINCAMCWKEFKQNYSWQKYCSRNCVSDFNRTEEHQRIIEEKALEREKKTWFKRPCQLPQVKTSWKDFSKINSTYKKMLEELWYNVSIEFPLWNYSYDLKIGNILIEINPSPTHNSTWWPAFEWNSIPKPKMYHYNKVKNATKNWYKCIMVRDWTKKEDIIIMIKNDFTYYWHPNLHWFNLKTKDHIIDWGFKKDDMISKWYVEIYDSWNILLS